MDRTRKPRAPPPRGLDVLNAAAGPRSRSLGVDVAALPGLLLKRLLGEGRDDSAALAFIDRSALAALSDDERLAFAFNLYHLCIAAAQRSGRYAIWGGVVPWFRRRPPFLALARLGVLFLAATPSMRRLNTIHPHTQADALRRASVDVGGVYVTPLALEHGWLRGRRRGGPWRRSRSPAGRRTRWRRGSRRTSTHVWRWRFSRASRRCGPASVPVYAAATVRDGATRAPSSARTTARRVCIALAPRLPPVCRYHAQAFGVDRARVAFAVASSGGGRHLARCSPGAILLRAGILRAPRRRRSRVVRPLLFV